MAILPRTQRGPNSGEATSPTEGEGSRGEIIGPASAANTPAAIEANQLALMGRQPRTVYNEVVETGALDRVLHLLDQMGSPKERENPKAEKGEHPTLFINSSFPETIKNVPGSCGRIAASIA